jgi:hypothetical protein
MRQYTYLGDRLTDPELKGKECRALERPDGKCIRGRNGTMLVQFEGGRKANVIGRLLRKKRSD